jgi:hypothetical protein
VQEPEETLARRDHPHVRRHRLRQQRRGLVLGERPGDRVPVVPGHDDGAGRLRRGDAGGRRDAQGRHPRAALGEQPVGVAVVGARELDHHLAAGRGAGQADGAHRRLGSGAGHPDHLDRGEARGDLLSQLDLARRGGPVAGAAPGGRLDRLDHVRVGVAEDQRPPGADPVHVAVAVDVDEMAALAALDEDRVAADLAHRPHG